MADAETPAEQALTEEAVAEETTPPAEAEVEGTEEAAAPAEEQAPETLEEVETAAGEGPAVADSGSQAAPGAEAAEGGVESGASEQEPPAAAAEAEAPSAEEASGEPAAEQVGEEPAEEPAGEPAALQLLEVAFIIQPEGFRHVEGGVDVQLPLHSLADRLERSLRIPASSLQFALEDGTRLPADCLLSEVAAEVGGVPDLHVWVEAVTPAVTGLPQRIFRTPGGTVILHVVPQPGTVVAVEIEPATEAKLFLGGYRHKNTGKEYHHAASQTPRPPAASKPLRFERDAQTVNMRTRSVLTGREAATQVARPGIFLDTDADREVVPGPYTTSEEVHRVRVLATVAIQRHMRGWAARKRASVLALVRDQRRAFMEGAAEHAEEEHSRAQQRELQRRLRPRSHTDFERLHAELDAWRKAEAAKISAADMPPAAAATARIALLNKETRLLGTLGRLRTAAAAEARDERMDRTLAALAAPKRWGAGGGVVEVHTPATARAAELVGLYRALRAPVDTPAARLETLRAMQRQAAVYDCMLTRDLLDLASREADLLSRRRPLDTMAPLRKRIANLFLQFIETPEFNPEAAQLRVAPTGFC